MSDPLGYAAAEFESQPAVVNVARTDDEVAVEVTAITTAQRVAMQKVRDVGLDVVGLEDVDLHTGGTYKVVWGEADV